MKKFLIKACLVINIIIIAGMLATGFSGILSPVVFSTLSISGYAFPAFAIANVVMIVVWVCVRLRMLIVPFLGFILSYQPMMTYCPVNMSKDIPDGCLKVMTFNTWGLCGSTENDSPVPFDDRRRELFRYIVEKDCDIVCLQETYFNEWVKADIDNIIRPTMPYFDSCYGPNHSSVFLFSKYPILRHERIEFNSAGNLSAAFFLDINGKETIVVNNHLETNHFSTEEKHGFHKMIKGGMEKEGIKDESKFIVRKLADAAALRAPQADAVAQFIRMHKGRAMLVCGDFNDIPLSYTYRTISHGLTDCYTHTATGPGFSYRKNGIYVRIDNILCSEEFTPFQSYVDKSIDISDHFPVISYVK